MKIYVCSPEGHTEGYYLINFDKTDEEFFVNVIRRAQLKLLEDTKRGD